MTGPIRKYHEDGTLPFGFEIFVAGTNLAGIHGAGAAKVAYERYGAAWGVAEGLMGQSYGIPTKDAQLRSLRLADVAIGVSRFVEFTHANPSDEFWVTAIGCGLARNTPEQIAPLFKDARNCNFPQEWKQLLELADLSTTNFK